MQMRRCCAVICTVLTVVLVAGCSSLTQLIATPTPLPQVLLIGTWQRTTPRSMGPFSVLLPDQIEFLQDGTWLVPGSGVLNGKYTILDQRRLKVEGFNIVYTPNFTVTSSGDLSLEDSGVTVQFTKSK